MVVNVSGEVLRLLPQKAVYWQKESMLLLADLHLGKVNHFRKSGIPVPRRAGDKNIELLMDAIQATKPTRVICLGDLFHSHYNPDWEVFGEVVKHFHNISFELVMGNHDIMSDLQYSRKGITVYTELQLGPFLLTHHPVDLPVENYYNLAGHLHPGVSLRGKGKQSLTLPCFYFGKQQGLLPAFGMFTGLARISPKPEDQVYIIAEEKVLEV
ncbi:MAG: ligase-associated DNA damage response endonuclease PdeM [Cyclobacteriaceae bacterium]|nr:ligase-associated DNA damage response endonuclease PdeM [Cyclobacteriaceae bacterium]